MSWIKRHKILVGVSATLFIAFTLMLAGISQAAIVFRLAGFAVVIWVVWMILRVIFPALKRKKKEVK